MKQIEVRIQPLEVNILKDIMEKATTSSIQKAKLELILVKHKNNSRRETMKDGLTIEEIQMPTILVRLRESPFMGGSTQRI